MPTSILAFMTLQYWFMAPAAVIIATLAMASGVGGATFFAPLLILALRLPPEVAIGTGLITEVFGFASGVYAYAKKRLIDYKLSMALLIVTIPLAIVGTLVAVWIPASVLKTVLGIGLVAVALSFLRSPGHGEVERLDNSIRDEYGNDKGKTSLVTAEGETITYTVCNRTEGRIIASIGALFVGMISTGLGELNGYFLLRRCRVPSRVSVATSVFVVALTALAASAGHVVNFIRVGGDDITTVLSIVIFTVPGVIVGAQIGSRIASRIPPRLMEVSLGILFVLIALLTLGEVVL